MIHTPLMQKYNDFALVPSIQKLMQSTTVRNVTVDEVGVNILQVMSELHTPQDTQRGHLR